MPIHLTLFHYLKIREQQLRGTFKQQTTDLANNMTGKEYVQTFKDRVNADRVRSFSGPLRVNELLKGVLTLIQRGQISANDAHWFKPGGSVYQLMEFACKHNATVALIFKKDTQPKKGPFVQGRDSFKLCTTPLKRVEISDADGNHNVVWKCWS